MNAWQGNESDEEVNMNLSRRVIGCGILSATMAIASVTTAVSGNETDTSQKSRHTITEEVRAAGVTKETVLKEASSEKSSTSEWEKKLLANVGKDTYLNVREKPTTDSAVVGKLYRGAGATIEKKGKEWTKIVSGDVTGYVKNEYCVFGEDARVFAEKNCDTHAVATEDGLRVREESDTDSKIITLLEEGDSVKVSKNAKSEDGWVAVKYNGEKAYVSADYVDVKLKIDQAVSIEEEQAEKVQTTGASVSASSDELYLLAAIIECEAGGEPYAGQLAVGAVVMNRVKSSSFPDSISGVIYQSGQFTPAGSGKLSRVLSSGKIGNSCYQAAREALSGADNTGGAQYFHAGTNGSGTVIGTQIFY